MKKLCAWARCDKEATRSVHWKDGDTTHYCREHAEKQSEQHAIKIEFVGWTSPR